MENHPPYLVLMSESESEETDRYEKLLVLKAKYEKILAKYDLSSRAEEIATEVCMSTSLDMSDFSQKYGMTLPEAYEFLDWIKASIMLKKEFDELQAELKAQNAAETKN